MRQHLENMAVTGLVLVAVGIHMGSAIWRNITCNGVPCGS